jgi:D-alanyl-lipoteichoic acid acyltransferase DltB (MBOAT superfamily)
MWVVFTFVAIWHDFKLDLILWAWIICLALIPEIAMLTYFDKERFYKKWWFKGACRLAAGFQIEMLCISNIIGFGSGHESMNMAINKFLSFDGFLCIAGYIFIRNGFAATA